LLDRRAGSSAVGRPVARARCAPARSVRWRCVLAAVTLSFAAGSGLSTAEDEPTAVWSVDPEAPGSSVPASGRSLFDYVFTVVGEEGPRYSIPYPFSALLETLRMRTGDHVRAVLIPLGRSLQRNAADPDYFESPRVVVAVDGDPAETSATYPGPLKDRLFLGYQERAATIEVISYNDAAGRFEFQVVQNYGVDQVPQVRYMERGVCTPCHQNQAPIFSRPLWDETNANDDVARRLAAIRPEFHGVPARSGIDIPDALDAATDRANWLAVYQRVWTDLCAATSAPEVCRSDLVSGALRYALAGQRHADRTADHKRLAAALSEGWSRIWPDGLAIPDPDLPNRRLTLFEFQRGPLDLPGALQHGSALSTDATVAAATVAQALEPLNRRPPLTIWYGDLDATRVDTIVAGIAAFFAPYEIAQIKTLASRGAAVEIARSDCTVADVAQTAEHERFESRYRLACAPSGDGTGWRLDATLVLRKDAVGLGYLGSGTLHRLVAPDSDPVRGLPIRAVSGRRSSDGFDLEPGPGSAMPLTTSGIAIRRISVHLDDAIPVAAATLELEVADDFRAIDDALGTLAARSISGESEAFAALPFRHSVVVAELLEALGAGAKTIQPAPSTFAPLVLQGAP
jgi:hypothetical protein